MKIAISQPAEMHFSEMEEEINARAISHYKVKHDKIHVIDALPISGYTHKMIINEFWEDYFSA